MEMEVVTLAVVCRKGDGEGIAHEMINSPMASYGLYSWGTDIRPATKDEVTEVIDQTPPEILNA